MTTPLSYFGCVSFMTYIMDDLHSTTISDPCCRDYTMIADGVVIYGFSTLEEAVAWKFKTHMKPSFLIEDDRIKEQVAIFIANRPEFARLSEINSTAFANVREAVKDKLPQMEDLD
jgi:hypothetical protein